MRLAGQVIASHYAAGVERQLREGARLRAAAETDAAVITELAAGDRFEMLSDALGWAWGYAGPERLVGYIETRFLAG